MAGKGSNAMLDVVWGNRSVKLVDKFHFSETRCQNKSEIQPERSETAFPSLSNERFYLPPSNSGGGGEGIFQQEEQQ